MENNKIQVILTATFGDGCVQSGRTYKTNCKMKTHLEFKHKLLGDLGGHIKYMEKNGYSQTYIWTYRSKKDDFIKEIHSKTLLEKLDMMDELGLTLWLLDDGSRHKKNHFYNINSHSFTKEDNEFISDYINKKFNIYSRVMIERKKDGRVFYYLHVPCMGGSHKLSKLIRNSGVDEYKYKCQDESIEKDIENCYNESTEFGLTEATLEHFNRSKTNYRRLTALRRRKK